MTATTAPASRVWTVRFGTTGTGMDLFHVYAPTMDDARESVIRTARESRSPALALMADTFGFTVHAGVPTTGLTLRENPIVALIPAPDLAVDANDVIPSAATHTFL